MAKIIAADFFLRQSCRPFSADFVLLKIITFFSLRLYRRVETLVANKCGSIMIYLVDCCFVLDILDFSGINFLVDYSKVFGSRSYRNSFA